MPGWGHAAVALGLAATMLADPKAEGPDMPPPGGYWGLHERRDPEPKDARTSLTVGAILLPLGVLRAAAGGVTVYTAGDARCNDIYNLDPKDCGSLRAYGWWGVGFGALMAVTGAVFLGIGFKQRAKHDEWRRKYGITFVPEVSRDRLGAGLTLRF